MKASHLIPGHSVSGYVDRILVIENTLISKPYILPLYPNGVPTLLFTSARGQIGHQRAGHLSLFGQTVLPESLTMKASHTLIAYFLQPYALLPLFGIAAQELTDKPLDLELLFPQKIMTLRERLLKAENTAVMLELLDQFMVDLIQTSKTACPLIKYASTYIARNPSKEALVTVQQELHITERTFQRLFEKHIGVAPNLFRRICQFNAAFMQLNSRKNYKLSDIAFQHGYADQSHYIRAFREFTHITPTAYRQFGEAH
jgi:AraC-like DNA-binding protein